MTCVLIVEDDPEMSTALRINLRARRYEVHAASDAQTALRLATTVLPDLAIVDLGLPDLDGIDVIRGLRGWTAVPIIVLSARDSQSDKVDSLDAGADDYLTKPFGMDELLARMRASLRRASPSNDDPVVITPTLRIDLGAKRILRDGVEVRLTPTEWYFLEALVRRPGNSCQRGSCCARSGDRTTPRRPTIFASIWPSCDAKSRLTPPILRTSSRSLDWTTGSHPDVSRNRRPTARPRLGLPFVVNVQL